MLTIPSSKAVLLSERKDWVMHLSEPLPRRAFLKAATATALGLGGTVAWGLGQGNTPADKNEKGQPQPQPSPQDEFGGFRVGVQSYSFRNFNLEQTLTRVRELGLRYIEFYRGHVPTNSTPDQIRAVRRLCADNNITPIAFGVERFSNDRDACRRLFEFGAALGVQHFSADPDPNSFEVLDRLVAEYRISIAIHPHGPAGNNMLHRWWGSEVILPAIRNHHALIGTCLDTGHLIRAAQLNRRLDPAAEIRAMGARNFGLHLKDHDNERRTDVIFGRGSLNVLSVLRALREVRFNGFISIEYEANPMNPSPDIRECLNVFREAVRQLNAG
jgi:inosose dehydratase